MDMDDELYEEFETVTMTDDETGEDIEFAIIDQLEYEGVRYILVVESEFIDDEESEAVILKEIAGDEEELTYEVIEDDTEFDRIAELFSQNSDDYDVER